jgi:hypothetical protein
MMLLCAFLVHQNTSGSADDMPSLARTRSTSGMSMTASTSAATTATTPRRSMQK